MTRVRFDPRVDLDDRLVGATVEVSAQPVGWRIDGAVVVIPAVQRFTVTGGTASPGFDLAEPSGFAWGIEVRQGTRLLVERFVTFSGPSVAWADLLDVDRSDLSAAYPAGPVAAGIPGPRGEKGDKGDTGPQGPVGPQGPAGSGGGGSGTVGPAGPQGPIGPQGPAGPQGDQGPAGETGARGAQGVQGPRGNVGDTGATGATGATGPKGDTGAVGAAGPKGDTGAAGAQGATGARGPEGPGGVLFAVAVNGGDITTTSPNPGTPLTGLDGNPIEVTFTAPASGRVLVEVSGLISAGTNTNAPGAGIATLEGGNVIDLRRGWPSATATAVLIRYFMPVTPGASIAWRLHLVANTNTQTARLTGGTGVVIVRAA